MLINIRTVLKADMQMNKPFSFHQLGSHSRWENKAEQRWEGLLPEARPHLCMCQQAHS